MASRVKKQHIDSSLLTEDEVKEVKLEAKRQVEAALKKRQMEELLAEEKFRLEHADDPNVEWLDITIHLAPFTDRIVLDGTIYLHGRKYSVPFPVYQTLQSKCSETWAHYDEVEGIKKDMRHPRGAMALRGGEEAIPARALLRRA